MSTLYTLMGRSPSQQSQLLMWPFGKMNWPPWIRRTSGRLPLFQCDSTSLNRKVFDFKNKQENRWFYFFLFKKRWEDANVYKEERRCDGTDLNEVITDYRTIYWAVAPLLLSSVFMSVLGTRESEMNQRCLVITALNLDLNVKCLPIDTHRLSTYVFNRMIMLYY